MVETLRQRAWDIAAAVFDPELPPLTIAELGILRDVAIDGRGVEIRITPTYSGCPAMTVIAQDIEAALAAAGIAPARITTVLAPAWTTDWLTESGRAKLLAQGIAPPSGAPRRALFAETPVTCPRCASPDTALLAEFGSTACKSLRQCRACREPFHAFKCH